MSNLKLSIITVNLNNLEGLKRTYESIVSQTFKNYEWLVIDGGSTDGSKEFIEQHQDKFSYWCSEPDKGIYNAMNKGIVRAKGEYLNFMNSGDCFACQETLEKVFKHSYTEDILYGYTTIDTINGEVFALRSMKDKLCWYELFTNTLPHQSSFIKRLLFDKIGLYDEELKVVSDSKWFATALINYGVSYKFIPQKIAIFEGGGICLTTDYSNERKKQREGVFPDYITEEDVENLISVSIIKSSKMARFIFHKLFSLAWRIDFQKRKKKLRSISSHANK
ncbi:MAG: glycosyltransferase family 2 protein [Bacteroidaceae bacterium]|nr:glycosyltransferase family 2 protein [Bacteroidaceae bacterium]